MKKVLFAALLAASPAVVFAQTAMQSDQQGPANAAVKGIHDNNASAPVAGANSFTESQAIKQIEAKGYTNVVNLTRDTNGVWHGMATKEGQPVPVSVDYQGNVN